MNKANGDEFGIVWCKEDILSRNEDLTGKQVSEVRSYLIAYFNAEVGISWDTIDDAIEAVLNN